MFDRWQQAVDEPQDLNIIPVMNLFMVLIPFLLMGAAFLHIGVIPTSTPRHNPAESDVPKTPTTVSANLRITADALSLTFSSTSMTPEELEAISAEWPKEDGKYDVEALKAHLIDIKEKYPKSTTITILPHDELGYQELVGVLDATRERQVGIKPDGDPKMAELFPVTVFSRLITAKGEAGGAEMDFGTEEAP